MREIRPSGSEGGGAEFNRPSLPLSLVAAMLFRLYYQEKQSAANVTGYFEEFAWEPQHDLIGSQSNRCPSATIRDDSLESDSSGAAGA